MMRDMMNQTNGTKEDSIHSIKDQVDVRFLNRDSADRGEPEYPPSSNMAPTPLFKRVSLKESPLKR